MSQTQLAARVGVTDGTVSQWLSGTISVSAVNARRLGDLFGEAPEFIMGLTDRGKGRLSSLEAKFEDSIDSEERVARLETALEKASFWEILDAGIASVSKKSEPDPTRE